MMTLEEMAALHTRAFAGQGRAWDADEIAAMLDSPHVFANFANHGFALTRAVADEAELLTIATDPLHQRKGVARSLLDRLEAEARARNARRLFLEVAENNAAACVLYKSAGYTELARRRGYYEKPDGGRADALILRKSL